MVVAVEGLELESDRKLYPPLPHPPPPTASHNLGGEIKEEGNASFSEVSSGHPSKKGRCKNGGRH